jgi:hypothetical protein
MKQIPLHIRVAGGITIAFALIVILIAWMIGGELQIPSERVSKALGAHAAMPVAFAMIAYMATHLMPIVFGKNHRVPDRFLQNLGYDFSLLLMFVIVTYLHFTLKMWIPVINPALFDAEYMAIDKKLRWLVDSFTWLSTALHTTLSEDVRWYQVDFSVMFILSFCYFSAERNAEYPRFAVGILLVLSIGGLSYLIAPALGPFIFETSPDKMAAQAQLGMHEAYQEVQKEGMAWILRSGSRYFTGPLAAMPSLHVAHATVMTYYMLRSRSTLAPLFVILWSWILIDSIALRWHYVVDAPAGFALALLVIWLTNWIFRGVSDDIRSVEPALDVATQESGDGRA